MLWIPSCRCWIWCEEDDCRSRIWALLFHACAAVDHELKESDSRIQYKSQKELQETNQSLRRTPSSMCQLKYRQWRPSLTEPDLKYPYKSVLIWLKSEISFFLHSGNPTNPAQVITMSTDYWKESSSFILMQQPRKRLLWSERTIRQRSKGTLLQHLRTSPARAFNHTIIDCCLHI